MKKIIILAIAVLTFVVVGKAEEFKAPTKALTAVRTPRLAKADLLLSEYSLTPSTPRQGVPVGVRIIVENRGSVPSGGPFEVWWFADRVSRGPTLTWSVRNIPPRGKEVLTGTFVYGYSSDRGVAGQSPWRIVTKVSVDAVAHVAESNEHNNDVEREVKVLPPIPPDAIQRRRPPSR
jgi:subtilase family serine protease